MRHNLLISKSIFLIIISFHNFCSAPSFAESVVLLFFGHKRDYNPCQIRTLEIFTEEVTKAISKKDAPRVKQCVDGLIKACRAKDFFCSRFPTNETLKEQLLLIYIFLIDEDSREYFKINILWPLEITASTVPSLLSNCSLHAEPKENSRLIADLARKIGTGPIPMPRPSQGSGPDASSPPPGLTPSAHVRGPLRDRAGSSGPSSRATSPADSRRNEEVTARFVS